MDQRDHALKAIMLYDALEPLFQDEDAPIDGGDLVEAIGLFMNDDPDLALSILQEMLEDQRSDPEE